MALREFMCPDGLTRQYQDGAQPEGCVPVEAEKKPVKRATKKAGEKDEG